MTQEQTHAVALMRYSVIAPLISGLQDNFSSHEAFFRDASARGVIAPDGTTKHFAPTTIKKWYNHYNKGALTLSSLHPELTSENQENSMMNFRNR